MNAENILKVEDLHASFFMQHGEAKAVRGVDLELRAGQIIGIVGESGCGKSVTVRSILRLLQKPGRITKGKILYRGTDLMGLKGRSLQKIRGNKISMIFQDLMSALNQPLTIGYQLREVIVQHNPGISRAQARARSLDLLRTVKISEPEVRLRQYPYEFSGGMLQRIMIAMALANDPDILIADEPTTALDVTIQDQILTLLKQLREDKGKSLILITHDLGVIAQTCDYVYVMYAGEVVERGSIFDIFEKPMHPYTVGLLNSLPSYQTLNKASGRLYSIDGAPPNLALPFRGCAFAPRCERALKLCLGAGTEFIEVGEGHYSRCLLCNRELEERLKNLPEGGTPDGR